MTVSAPAAYNRIRAERPALNPEQTEALDLVESIAGEPEIFLRFWRRLARTVQALGRPAFWVIE